MSFPISAFAILEKKLVLVFSRPWSKLSFCSLFKPNNLLKNPGGVDDLTVEDGDVIDIPILKQTVKISGEVIHPTTVAYKSNFNFKDYINHSGGFTQKSARKRAYVIYANGNIDRARSFGYS